MTRRRHRPDPFRYFREDLDRIIDRRTNSATDKLFSALLDDITVAAEAAGSATAAVIYVERAIRYALARGQGKLVAALTQDIRRIAEEAAMEGARRTAHAFEQLDGSVPPVLTNEVMLQNKARMRASVDAEALSTNFAPVLLAALVVAVDQAMRPKPQVDQAAVTRAEQVQAAVSAIKSQRYIAERAAVWHATHAFNATQGDIFEEVWPHVPDLMKRWTEKVSDSTGLPLDNRVAVDSRVMHGQVAFPTGVFVMPPDPRVPKSLQGKQWSHPPNRPHDRAVLTPWRPSWGIPGWIWRNGQKLAMKRSLSP